MKKLITIFCLLPLLMSCVKNASLTITKNVPERPKDCALDVFISENDIKRPYETVCIIDTKTGKSGFERKRLNKVIDLARPLACSAGADGLFLLSAGRTNGSGAFDIGSTSNGIFKGIKYTDGGPSPVSVQQKPLTPMERSNAAFKAMKEEKLRKKAEQKSSLK